jgi:hypothetical protein
MSQTLTVAEYPFIRFTLSEKLLRRVGLKAATMIVDRTQAGQDADGKPFAPYSTRDLYIPAGATTKAARVKLDEQGKLTYFTYVRTRSLWIIVQGGYAALKMARYPQDSRRVNLTASGAMLRGLRPVRVTRTEKGGEVVLGFSRDELAQRASYVEKQGRRFLGLTSAEEAKLEGLVEGSVEVAVG